MKLNKKSTIISFSALLIAIGILIPIVSPIKIIIEPASFTLASHVPIFIGLFISPPIGVAVSLGTAVGFFLGGFPIPVVLRALSHVVFALIGGTLVCHYSNVLEKKVTSFFFSLFLGLIHAVSEVIVVSLFYISGQSAAVDYTNGFFFSIFVLVGVGTVIHSMIDFSISKLVWSSLKKRLNLSVETSAVKSVKNNH